MTFDKLDISPSRVHQSHAHFCPSWDLPAPRSALLSLYLQFLLNSIRKWYVIPPDLTICTWVFFPPASPIPRSLEKTILQIISFFYFLNVLPYHHLCKYIFVFSLYIPNSPNSIFVHGAENYSKDFVFKNCKIFLRPYSLSTPLHQTRVLGEL